MGVSSQASRRSQDCSQLIWRETLACMYRIRHWQGQSLWQHVRCHSWHSCEGCCVCGLPRCCTAGCGSQSEEVSPNAAHIQAGLMQTDAQQDVMQLMGKTRIGFKSRMYNHDQLPTLHAPAASMLHSNEYHSVALCFKHMCHAL